MNGVTVDGAAGRIEIPGVLMGEGRPKCHGETRPEARVRGAGADLHTRMRRPSSRVFARRPSPCPLPLRRERVLPRERPCQVRLLRGGREVEGAGGAGEGFIWSSTLERPKTNVCGWLITVLRV